MAKRGEKLPWKVIYQWSTGVGGKIACHSEDSANMKANEIRRHGANRDDAEVTVEVVYVA